MEGSGKGFYFHAPCLNPFLGISQSSSIGDGSANSPLFTLPADAAAGYGVRAPLPAMEPVKRKRGRPRKYGPPLSSSASPPLPASLSFPHLCLSGKPAASMSLSLAPSSPPQASSRGKGIQRFNPHLFTVTSGEDVAQRITSFAQEQKRAVCVISASGSLAIVTLHQPAAPGGLMTYKGNLDIISLSGSFLYKKMATGIAIAGALSVCVSDGGFIVGGSIAGPLIACSSVEVVAVSFLVDPEETQSK
ncbi:AT-hook motif nuclear-localized protein 10-like isoform X2 [Wolffia australiana]